MRVPESSDELDGRCSTRTPLASHTNIRIIAVKPICFVRSAKQDLSRFPLQARRRAGHELFMLQVGRAPDNWKPIAAVGAGACEIRVRDATGAFRVVYVAKFERAIYVLHAFQKKTQRTAKVDVNIARQRYREARRIAEGTRT